MPVLGEKPLQPGEKRVEVKPEGTPVEKFLLPSAAMGRAIPVVAVLPQAYAADPARRFPVLYALHGHSAPFATYSEMSTLRESLRTYPMLVVSFHGDIAGWYLDAPQKKDSQFTTFFFDELIPHIERTYRAASDARSRAVTGFSMGAFGAFHYLLTHPDRFGSVSGSSGSYAPARINERPQTTPEETEFVRKIYAEFEGLLGPQATHAANWRVFDLEARFREAVARGQKLPPLRLDCGTADELLPVNRRARDFLRSLGLAVEYTETPGGHNWPYWKGAAPGVIEFHGRAFAL